MSEFGIFKFRCYNRCIYFIYIYIDTLFNKLSAEFLQLGMERMFTKEAEFGKILKSPENFEVSKIIHKAFIEVNEKGTEAAAATGK